LIGLKLAIAFGTSELIALSMFTGLASAITYGSAKSDRA
jgi:hypothetical protein